MPKLNLFFALTKVDEAQRLVYGVATAEQPDKSGEICDYATTVPRYQKWSEDIAKASGGKSLGNVREMHDSKAVGKLTMLTFNDEEKQVEICAKIVEESTWQKVLEGVLTGFSQGGSYVKQWKDPNNPKYTRYTADPAEISVVDNPCLPSAAFELIRADGSHEMRKFDATKIAGKKVEQKWETTDGKTHITKAEAIRHQAKVDASALAAPALDAADKINKALDAAAPRYWETEEYVGELVKGTQWDTKNVTDVEKKEFSEKKRKEMAARGDAMADGSFPIENAKDVENAVHDWGRTGSKPDVKAHIMRRAKAIDAEASVPDDWKSKAKEKAALVEALKKASEDHEIGDASCAMNALRDLIFLLWREEHEVERGDSEEQAQVTMIETAIEKLKEFIVSELQEKVDDEDEEEELILIMAAAGINAEMAKTAMQDEKFRVAIGKRGRHSKSDAARIAKMHGHVEDMGDHLTKLSKMHKAMMEDHDEAGESTHAEHHAEMASHLKKLDKHIEKMHKCHGGMEECMKGLGVGSEGAGGQNGSPPEEKALHAEELHKALADGDALKGVVTQLSDTISALQKRLEIVEKEPSNKGSKPAVFAVTKGNEVHHQPEDHEPVDAETKPNVFGNGMSPAAARSTWGR